MLDYLESSYFIVIANHLFGELFVPVLVQAAQVFLAQYEDFIVAEVSAKAVLVRVTVQLNVHQPPLLSR